MSRLSEVMDKVSAGDTLRDTAGHTYFVRGFKGHGKEAQMVVLRERDQQERAVYADVVWAMLSEAHLWKVSKKGKTDGSAA